MRNIRSVSAAAAATAVLAATILATVLPATVAQAATSGTVDSPKVPLNARTGAYVWKPKVGTIPNGAPVAIECQVKGQLIDQGTVRVTNLWDRLTDGTYVSDAWIRRPAADLPLCDPQTNVAAPTSAPPTSAPPTTPPPTTAPPTTPPPSSAAPSSAAPSSAAPSSAAPTTAAPTTAPTAQAAASGTVNSPKVPLNARTGAYVWKPKVGTIPNGATVAIECQVKGQLIDQGTVRVTDLWDRLTNGTYVSDAWIDRPAKDLPLCGPQPNVTPTNSAAPSSAAPTTAAPTTAPTAQAAASGTVDSPKVPLNARTGAYVWKPKVGTIPNGATVAIECQVKGQLIDEGTVRVTDLWDRLTNGTYVSDAFIRRPDADLPLCGHQPNIAPTTAPPSSAAPSDAPPSSAAPSSAPPSEAPSSAPPSSAPPTTAPPTTAPPTTAPPTTAPPTTAPPTTTAPPPPTTAPVVAPAAPVWVSPLPGRTAEPGFRPGSHVGVDIMAPTGTPIRAASAGTVVTVACNITWGFSCDRVGNRWITGCGWYVKIQHADGISTLYCHMVRRGVVNVGQKVTAGQLIGYVGSSGNSSAPHLHFEVHTNSPPTTPKNAINPLPFMRSRGAPIG
ncbi:peptidoglycan DD-metalloendopeptidase family protein [Dactylosporangium sp. NPDC051484]|uniref:peptidoglycan DD-metalloendopeptidase family protein n=1 Tax=Dactylosporangium sp. NPDC051484 TaxID=3154942 RepID=UPI00344D16F2